MKHKNFKRQLLSALFSIIFFAVLFFAKTFAQSGGDFTLTQAVIAGGGQPSTSGSFMVDGTIGQSLAGNSTGGNFATQGGFWTAPLAPTAAVVSVAGRITTASGNGVRNAIVTMTDAAGTIRSVPTGSFGYFRFDEVAVGETYIFAVRSKRFQFVPQVVSVMEELTELNFIAQF